jgi:hypothetical protein
MTGRQVDMAPISKEISTLTADVQRSVQPDADLVVRGTDPSVPSWPERDAAGRFVPGNLAAVKHALSATKLPPEFDHLEGEVDAFVAGCLTDEADEQDVSTRRRSLLNYRARVHRRIVQLDAALEVRGLVDRKGKLRAGWLQRLEGRINVAKGLDAMLGLERRQKRVPSLSEVMAE